MNIQSAVQTEVTRLSKLTNEQLVRECNRKPDFKNDNEICEISKRIDAGALKVVMAGNWLHIVYGESNAEDYLKQMFNPSYTLTRLKTEILKPHSEIFLNDCILQTQPNHEESKIEYFIKTVFN